MNRAENRGTWTDDNVALLKRLWTEGQSASQISRQIRGTTRNSVIAKVDRLRKAGAPGIGMRAAPAAPTARRVATPKVEKPARRVAQANPAELRVQTIVKNAEVRAKPSEDTMARARAFRPLRGHEPVPFGSKGCAWPVSGEGAEMLCCGVPRDGERPYCAAHAAAAYQPLKASAPKNGNELMRALRRWAA